MGECERVARDSSACGPSPLRDHTALPQELFRQLRDLPFLEFMEGMDGLLVANIPLPSPDRAGIRRVQMPPARIVAGRPVRPQELPEDLMAFALIEARDFQITFRLRRDAFAPLAVLLGRYPRFPFALSSDSQSQATSPVRRSRQVDWGNASR